MGEPSTFTIDIGGTTGWCFGRLSDANPICGVWLLPDTTDLGERYVALDNSCFDAFSVHQPTRVVCAAPLHKAQTSAQFLIGAFAIVQAAAYRAGARTFKVAESTARKHVLGRGTFGTRDPANRRKLIKGTATEQAKAAAMAFCQTQGWRVATHDAADAAVLWTYDRDCQRAWRPLETAA